MEPEQEMSPEEVADWLDELDGPTPEEMCGSATLISGNKLRRLFCGRFRTCPRCFKHRVKTWREYLRAAMHQKGGVWRWKVYEHEEAAAKRKTLAYYYSFPIDEGTVLVSPGIDDGEAVPLFDEDLKALCEKWVLTPRGMRPSRSGCFVYRKPEEETSDAPAFIASTPLSTVAEVAEALGGQVADVEGNPDVKETVNVDNVELAYELILRGNRVRLLRDRDITLTGSETIFDSVRAKRAVSDPA